MRISRTAPPPPKRLLPRLALPLALTCALTLSHCSGPKVPTVREPLWPFKKISDKQLGTHLEKAAAAWDILKSPPSRAARAQAEAHYEEALALMLRDRGRGDMPRKWQDASIFTTKDRSYRVHLQPAPGTPEEVSPLMLDRLLLSDTIPLPHKSAVAREEGLGIPVIGQVAYTEARAERYPMLPLNGAYLPLTAVMDFGPEVAPGQVRDCYLHLYNPLRKPQAPVAGRPQKLAADYTAPRHLAMNNRFLKSFRLIGLLFPNKVLDESQLYRLDIYDPKRIPVVFVHGLMSDPHIWFDSINAIQADPVLRAHYQPWYFLYPTGMAVPATSGRLRVSLEEARQKLDPEGDDPGMNNMVLVGHSMGGLLSRMQTIDSGDSIWNAYFQCEPEKLNVSSGTLQRLKDTLRFKRQPYIKRLIFITVPHKGSSMADRGIVRRLTSLIRLPVDSMVLAKELLTGNVDYLTPQMRDWGTFGLLSIGTLSPQHPYLKALNEQPIPVPHHSVVGHWGKGPLLESSDRVVPYSSSHLDTGTELVVPYWHGCVEKPEVTAEIVKRLHQHLRESKGLKQ